MSSKHEHGAGSSGANDRPAPGSDIVFGDEMLDQIQACNLLRSPVNLIQTETITYGGVSNCKTCCALVLLEYNQQGDSAKCRKQDFVNKLRAAKAFLEESLRGDNLDCALNDEEKDLAIQIHNSRSDLGFIEILIVTNMDASEVKEYPLDKVIFESNGQQVTVDLHTKVYWERSPELAGDPEQSEICLDGNILEGASSVAIMAEANDAGASGSAYKAFSFFVKAKMLRDIYEKYGGRLLESNVRDFLDSRNKVNAGILETILKRPSDFLAFNNGIVCTSTKVGFEVVDGESTREKGWKTVFITSIGNFQIINGGQTTSSIFFADKRKNADLDKIIVQAKLIELPSGENGENFSAEIAKFANSQSKVSASDLMSNNQFQRDMERQSRQVSVQVTSKGAPRQVQWYYERTRGSYNNARNKERLADAEREFLKQHPLDRRFAKTDFAIYEMAFRGRPYVSCLGSQKCFEAFSQSLRMSGGIKVDEAYFQHAVAKVIAYRETVKMFDAMAKANISPQVRGSRAETVAYAVGLVAANSEYRINLAAIFKNQDIGNKLRGLLKSALVLANKYLVSEATTAGNIPRTISQKEQTWENFLEDNRWSPEELGNEASRIPYFDPSIENEKESEWDSTRIFFLNDSRKFKELGLQTGHECTISTAKETIGKWAAKSFSTIQKAVRFPEMLGLMVRYIQHAGLAAADGSIVLGSTFTIRSEDGQEIKRQLVASPKKMSDSEAQIDLGNPLAPCVAHKAMGHEFVHEGMSWKITSLDP